MLEGSWVFPIGFLFGLYFSIIRPGRKGNRGRISTPHKKYRKQAIGRVPGKHIPCPPAELRLHQTHTGEARVASGKGNRGNISTPHEKKRYDPSQGSRAGAGVAMRDTRPKYSTPYNTYVCLIQGKVKRLASVCPLPGSSDWFESSSIQGYVPEIGARNTRSI